MFDIDRGHIIAVIAVITCMYPLWGMFLNKGGKGEKAQKIDAHRRGLIDEKIQSINGKVLEIEQVKRSECPVIDVVEVGIQVQHICYRVSYSVGTRIEETWALMNVKKAKQPIIWPEFEDEE